MISNIAICIPSGRTWEAEMAIGLMRTLMNTPLDTSVQWMMGSQITHQRNELVRRGIEAGATHLFWLDSDIILPENGMAIMELLAHEKDIVGATYLKKVSPFTMLGKLERRDGRLKPASLMPGGCMLVKKNVYQDIGWPWYYEKITPPKLTWEQGTIQSEDYSFCEKARAKDYEIWCDINLSQRIQHIGAQNIRMQLGEGHEDRVEV